MNNDPVFEVVTHTRSQRINFAVFTFTYHVGSCITVADTFNTLLNNRAFIEVSGNVVAGCTNEFYAAIIGLLVGLGPGKGGQKAVMDINCSAGQF